MTDAPVQVASGVWLVCTTRAAAGRSRHPADLAAAERLEGRRAAEFLGGRALLRALLDTVLPAARDAAVHAERRGRPVVAAFPRLGVSLSHDGDLVAAAAADGRAVGVDVQYPRFPPDPRMLRRCLHEHAPAVSRTSLPEQAHTLARVWAVQEACVKAQGTGLAGLPWRIPVPPDRDTGQWRGYSWLSLRDRTAVPLACAFARTPGASSTEGTS